MIDKTIRRSCRYPITDEGHWILVRVERREGLRLEGLVSAQRFSIDPPRPPQISRIVSVRLRRCIAHVLDRSGDHAAAVSGSHDDIGWQDD
jgi:hypothetical protein